MPHSGSRVWGFIRTLAAAGAFAVSAGQDASAQIIDPYTNTWNIPTPSLYGGVGLLDMRNARFMPDGYLWLDTSLKSPDDRVSLNFQATPWLETTFRYAINYALPPEGQRALYDRSFDVKFRLFQETQYTPQVALGLQDFIGTGVYFRLNIWSRPKQFAHCRRDRLEHGLGAACVSPGVHEPFLRNLRNAVRSAGGRVDEQRRNAADR